MDLIVYRVDLFFFGSVGRKKRQAELTIEGNGKLRRLRAKKLCTKGESYKKKLDGRGDSS